MCGGHLLCLGHSPEVQQALRRLWSVRGILLQQKAPHSLGTYGMPMHVKFAHRQCSAELL